ncbi:signal peptidase II [Microbispora triticiradicis]|uniref:signal peptidase II n=1 Tax=Microbispora triticiradicis TaxID=2200763 RepID=UPI0027DEA084|nr:signal peptidase II [Microbispora triticiradicis]
MQAAGGAPLSGAGPARPGNRARRIALLVVVATVIYALDQASKFLVVKFLEHEEPLTVVPGALVLTVIRNAGAAFSIGTGMTIVFTVIALTVVVAIVRTARQLRSLPWAITLGLLLGGAVGNLTDRIFRSPAPFQGHVVDFIQVFPVTRFPVFNVADSAIVCGGVLAVFLAWRGYQIDGTRQTEEETSGSGAEQAAEPAGNESRAETRGEVPEQTPERIREQAGDRSRERADG